MKTPEIPANESERLFDLYDYGILETPPEKFFDEAVQLAATICGTQFAAVTLIDRQFQWFRSKYGLDVPQVTRDESICGHAILTRELFEVRDMQEDERFADNPLLAGDPKIRFYGGSQLLSDRGNAIGMLCVMDTRPQVLSVGQRQALTQLADLVMAAVEAGRSARLASWFGTLLDNAQDEMLIIDPATLKYLHANLTAQKHLGRSLDQMRCLTPMDVNGDTDRGRYEGFISRLRAGEPFVTFTGMRRHTSGETYPVEAQWQLLSIKGRSVVLSTVRTVAERLSVERVKDQFIKRITGELEFARSMQRGSLPKPTELLGLNMAWFFEASSFVGGDNFEYFSVDERHGCFFMLDVAGHGVSAAMMALSAQHQLSGIARREGAALLAQGCDLGEVSLAIVHHYNDLMLVSNTTSLYVTLVLGVWDSHTRRMAMVQAGHPPALVFNPGGLEPLSIGDGGVPIGILYETDHVAHEIQFAAGSRIVLYSDGVTDCRNSLGENFGEERLTELLSRQRSQPIAEVARLLGDELNAWRAGFDFEDDVSILLMEAA